MICLPLLARSVWVNVWKDVLAIAAAAAVADVLAVAFADMLAVAGGLATASDALATVAGALATVAGALY